MRTVIHQPDFAPYLGFFDRLKKASLFIVLDHVQFVQSSRSWTHRDKFLTPNGPKWLTIGIQKTSRHSPINTICMSEVSCWREKHLAFLYENYKNADRFREAFPIIEELYGLRTSSLVDFNLNIIKAMCGLLEINTPVIMSSSLEPVGAKTDLIIDLLLKTASRSYLSGVGAKAYTQEELFARNNIQLEWQNFDHPTYAQTQSGFEPYLSCFDALLNCGIDGFRKLFSDT